MKIADIVLVLLVLAGAFAASACRTTSEEVDDGTRLILHEVAPEGPEAISLLGEPLEPVENDAETAARLEANLADALATFWQDPVSEDGTIWLGRRYAYLMRYRESVAVYTYGLSLYPRSYRLRRHRGHRFITLRRFDDAVRDLAMAAEWIADVPDALEPDGAPNAQGIPRSTLHSNVWYHLGLAHFLLGDYAAAAEAYTPCLEVSKVNDDMLVATTHWAWMTQMRLGNREAAAALLEPISAEMDVIENTQYHQLLLFYKGERELADILPSDDDASVASATTLFGVANWFHVNGRIEEALELERKIVAETNWAAFGHIAAEADVAR